MPDDEHVYPNGINAVTGDYLTAPVPIGEFADLITQINLPQSGALLGPTLGLPPGCSPFDISQAGWGIVFAADEAPEVRKALSILVHHRRKQVGIDNASMIKELEYRAGDTRAGWLARHGVTAGAPDPSKIPYYLLLVGSPRQIPFDFGFLLDIEYAVGRIGFAASSDYEIYARSVVTYETSAPPILNSQEVLFFATEHGGDGATRLSSQQLAQPLAECVPKLTTALRQDAARFVSRRIFGTDATKCALIQALRSPNGLPAPIIFSATHGLGGWRLGSPDQFAKQGALVCEDWLGVGKIDASEFFCALDLPSDARLNGVIAFLFACFSGGTPQYDRFPNGKTEGPAELASEPFFARLPQSILAHPNGGALACIGHVDRAWGYSIAPPDTGAQILPFRNFLHSLLLGYQVGHAIQDFNHRYSVLSTDLTGLLEKKRDFGVLIPDKDLARVWIQRNDAEGYIIFGDPAVRLRIAEFS